MKRSIFSLIFTLSTIIASAQAVQPSMMVCPSAAWCHDNGFEQIITKANGKEVRIQEYSKAFIDNKELGPTIRTIGAMMKERGFELVDMETQLSSMSFEDALDNASETEIELSEYDKLLSTAGPDIALHVNYYTENVGPRVTLFYDLTAFDTYTNKQVASTGSIQYGPVMSIPLTSLIQSALLQSIDAFNEQLMAHFMDMKEFGREISVRINTTSSLDDGLETDVNGKELTEIIEKWMSENCVSGRNHQKMASEKLMYYDSARIPLYGEDGKAVQAKQWLNGLRKYLKTLGITSKVKTRGLGQAQLIIGE